ncbi:hypothetical protein CR513_47744, partial [Mucuna pruriens]
MVNKSSEKWKMCTNYTYLNIACPKDPYPLPNIDDLVDGASGCRLLSFMDAYSGYNQIRMHLSDESKTAFIIDEGNFCYNVMSFGLKLQEQWLDVYIDNMVVKFETEDRHVEALTSIFSILRDHRLKLNHDKCSFGVRVGKFLGFMLIDSLKVESIPAQTDASGQNHSGKNVQDQDLGSWKLLEVIARYSQNTLVDRNLNVRPSLVHHYRPSKAIVVESGLSGER